MLLQYIPGKKRIILIEVLSPYDVNLMSVQIRSDKVPYLVYVRVLSFDRSSVQRS